jgi:glutamate 5-kinase
VSHTRANIAAAKRLVVKIGSAALTGGSDTLDRAYMHDLAAQCAGAMDAGREVILVSSGAVAGGLKAAGFDARPKDVAGQQAAAAAGQPLLMALWHEAFGVRKRSVAQILLSRSDFDSRDRFLNIRNCAGVLLERGVTPIVNENDTVATEEISLGDNDVLAAKLATAVLADALVILSTAGGVMDATGKVVPEAPDAASLTSYIRTDMSGQGRGGMTTKLEAARIASLIGVPTVIAPGRPADTLGRVLRGEAIGTCITAAGTASERHGGRRTWIGLSATPSGTLEIDDGAARALRERGASLLAKGVRAVSGTFNSGDVVLVRDAQGREVARGLTNFSSSELSAVRGRDSGEFEAILGRQTHAEVVHRDNMVVG